MPLTDSQLRPRAVKRKRRFGAESKDGAPSRRPPPAAPITNPLSSIPVKKRKNLLRKGIPYVPKPSENEDKPSKKPKVSAEVARDQSIKLLWDPAAITKQLLGDLYAEVTEVNLTANLTGGFLKFSENKFARQAFVKEEQTLLGHPAFVEPCSKDMQAQGFQGFLIAPVIKILAAYLKDHIPGLISVQHYTLKTFAALLEPDALDAIRNSGGASIPGQRLLVARPKEAAPHYHLTVRCQAPELVFRALKRLCPKVTGVKFHPKGTCGVAVFQTPEDADVVQHRGTDTLHGVPVLWRKSSSHLPTECFVVVNIRKVLEGMLKQGIRGDFKLKELPKGQGWRLTFGSEEHFKKALAKKKVDLKEYGFCLALHEQ